MFKVSGNEKHDEAEGVTRPKSGLEVSKVMYCGPIWVKMIEFVRKTRVFRWAGC